MSRVNRRPATIGWQSAGLPVRRESSTYRSVLPLHRGVVARIANTVLPRSAFCAGVSDRFLRWWNLVKRHESAIESRKGAGPGPTGSRWFPFSAHRTGRAHFEHPALRQTSPQAQGSGPRCTSRGPGASAIQRILLEIRVLPPAGKSPVTKAQPVNYRVGLFVRVPERIARSADQ
jgi:hypothetical protein